MAKQIQSWRKQHPTCSTVVSTRSYSIHIRFPDAELDGRWPPLPLPLETNYPTYGGGVRTPRAVGGRGEIQGVVRCYNGPWDGLQDADRITKLHPTLYGRSRYGRYLNP